MTDIPRAHASFPTGRYRFGFEFDTVESSIVHSSGQCWHNMFNNAVVVKGYPILSRAEAGTGMEVSLNVMAGLARADRLDQFGGATLIKGFSSLLIPMKKSEDSIIWHLIYNSDGSRISYLNKILSHVGPVTTLDVGNFRHILGWCAEAQFYAGKNIHSLLSTDRLLMQSYRVRSSQLHRRCVRAHKATRGRCSCRSIRVSWERHCGRQRIRSW